MRRLVTPVWVALLFAFLAVSTGSADRQDPNFAKLADPSADVRAAAAQALGGG